MRIIQRQEAELLGTCRYGARFAPPEGDLEIDVYGTANGNSGQALRAKGDYV